jgi:hypothetical protein
MNASARRYPSIGMDGERFYLRRWLEPHANWFAHGIASGQFHSEICQNRLGTLAETLAQHAGFQRPAHDIVDPRDLIREKADDLDRRIDQVVDAIRAEVRPMISARRPLNFILAAAHDVNARADFLIRETDVTNIVREAVRDAIHPPRLARGGRAFG